MPARVPQWRHIANRVDLKSRRAHAQCRVVGAQGNRLIQVLRFHNRDTAQQLLGRVAHPFAPLVLRKGGIQEEPGDRLR